MKYLKNFESFNYSNEDELIEKIRDTVDSLAYDFESFDDFDPNDHPEIKFKMNLYFSLMGKKRRCNSMSNKLKKKVFNDLKIIFGDVID